MPYIKPEWRERIDDTYGGLARTTGSELAGAGELTYVLTKVIVGYLGEEPSYADFADAIAALECSKLELYRRRIAPHENSKQAENGDVY